MHLMIFDCTSICSVMGGEQCFKLESGVFLRNFLCLELCIFVFCIYIWCMCECVWGICVENIYL